MKKSELKTLIENVVKSTLNEGNPAAGDVLYSGTYEFRFYRRDRGEVYKLYFDGKEVDMLLWIDEKDGKFYLRSSTGGTADTVLGQAIAGMSKNASKMDKKLKNRIIKGK